MENWSIEKKLKTFKPADLLAGFSADYLDEYMCRAWLLEKLHKDRPACPGCGAAIKDATALKNFYQLRRFRCKNCLRQYTALNGTVLHGMKMSIREIYLLAILIALEIPNRQIAQILGMHPDSVKLWIARLEGI